MNVAATLANCAWLARSIGPSMRFSHALADPEAAQSQWLRAQLERHARSEFGRAHAFDAIANYADFARRVDVTGYADVAPFVRRIQRGERDVLAVGRVSHLAPTSGTSGARKLIPFSASLQSGFSTAVSVWMNDLFRQRPALAGGPAYWSVSPLADDDDAAPNEVRVGFADDADYLGGAGAWLVRQTLAAPSALRYVRDETTFWQLTLLALLRCRELRLISVWHPSFLDLLVGAAQTHWSALLERVPGRARADELARIGPEQWPRWWPRLQVVSCWGEQAAHAGWERLRAKLPHVLVQAKGLLATEAVVTIPYRDRAPLALTSHFFEFIDDAGNVRRAHELERGRRYEVLVTNGGGLWRYRLGDVVECTGHLAATPTLRFLGRATHVSDLRGEKLSEAFVADAIRSLWDGTPAPAYAVLRAWEEADSAGYELLLSNESYVERRNELSARLDAALRGNPNYALARRLGQLQAPRLVPVSPDAGGEELRRHHGRLGDAKPRVLIGARDLQRS